MNTHKVIEPQSVVNVQLVRLPGKHKGLVLLAASLTLFVLTFIVWLTMNYSTIKHLWLLIASMIMLFISAMAVTVKMVGEMAEDESHSSQTKLG